MSTGVWAAQHLVNMHSWAYYVGGRVQCAQTSASTTDSALGWVKFQFKTNRRFFGVTVSIFQDYLFHQQFFAAGDASKVIFTLANTTVLRLFGLPKPLKMTYATLALTVRILRRYALVLNLTNTYIYFKNFNEMVYTV
jgi:hypothetical protein